MSKAVAIPYIVAIILAVIVIAVIGYFLFFKGGFFLGTANEQECRAREVFYCGQWAKSDYVTKPKCKPEVTAQLQECDFNTQYKECASFDWAASVGPPECKSLLSARIVPQTTTTQTPATTTTQ